jgi:hypothetical protein
MSDRFAVWHYERIYCIMYMHLQHIQRLVGYSVATFRLSNWKLMALSMYLFRILNCISDCKIIPVQTCQFHSPQPRDGLDAGLRAPKGKS